MYEYEWVPGGLATPKMIDEMANLYSKHYGRWGSKGISPNNNVKLSGKRIKEGWLASRDSRIVRATAFGELVGYAIAIQTRLPRLGIVSWVTQLVVHEDHRRSDVGKTLLFTIWQFSNHYAWGLITANPYAVRALEKATRRRCLPSAIKKHRKAITRLGTKVAPYATLSSGTIITAKESRTNTAFFLDHSELPEMLKNATEKAAWCLGSLQEGWEWFAFTFRDQEQIKLTREETEKMLLASDAVTKDAYSRMLVQTGAHSWAKFAAEEASFVIENCALGPGKSVLDFGCGAGRHSLALAELGSDVVGVDYIQRFVEEAKSEAASRSLKNASFLVADCRNVVLEQGFDAGICLYDAIGSYTNEQHNFSLIENLAKHVKPNGYILLSVMNMELTERKAKNWFDIESDPDRLLTLLAGNRMERSGEVFDPDYYLIDVNTKIVYRKEQFTEGGDLPAELLVRDRRYTKEQIEDLCRRAGLDVVWSRFTRAGRWNEHLMRDDDHAKEILILCRKPALAIGYLFPED
jgi:2-polyprenyl-3-methyl-5-hydroxy-6-metoxy-1,4-benzoquinol methylase